MPQQEETLANLISAGYLKTPKIIEAMKKIRRENFLPDEMKLHAWEDHPLPIGFGQTISAPHMYSIMLEAAKIAPGDNVLEVGAGSGYGAALLSFLVGNKGKVYSIELVHELVGLAKKNIAASHMDATVIEGDGKKGHAKAAPYDKILVTAAAESIPPSLAEQLKIGGRLLIPVGRFFQELLLVEKKKSGPEATSILPVVFVPLR